MSVEKYLLHGICNSFNNYICIKFLDMKKIFAFGIACLMFVGSNNLLAQDEIIDLSEGGIHHSWEENAVNHPQGNIVYELCKDIMDPVSSIRSFDKGKIKDDGTVREVHIDSYFELVDRNEETNNPSNHKLVPKILFEGNKITIESLLRSQAYCLDKITLEDSYSGDHTKAGDSYHHLFVKKYN